MIEREAWKSPAKTDMSVGTFSRHAKNNDNISVTGSKKTDYENMSATEVIADQREKIQKLQLKSANYRQKENKLKRDGEYLKKQVTKLEVTIEKLEEHREQDAEALLEQEQKLSQLKGKYRNTENPNETAKVKKNIQTVTKEENQVLKDIKGMLDSVYNVHKQLAEIVPGFYEQLRTLKFYGDKQMNEILLRQIHIYVEQLQDKAKEYEKQKIAKYEENKELRKKLKEKYEEHEQLKIDTVEDYKHLYGLQRKLNFLETDFMIEREEQDKIK